MCRVAAFPLKLTRTDRLRWLRSRLSPRRRLNWPSTMCVQSLHSEWRLTYRTAGNSGRSRESTSSWVATRHGKLKAQAAPAANTIFHGVIAYINGYSGAQVANLELIRLIQEHGGETRCVLLNKYGRDNVSDVRTATSSRRGRAPTSSPIAICRGRRPTMRSPWRARPATTSSAQTGAHARAVMPTS
jgi:hypothetical protein